LIAPPGKVKPKRHGKTLTAPFSAVGNLGLQSWSNEHLPDVLWAALLTQLEPRDTYLVLFRAVSDTAEKFRDGRALLTHSQLTVLSTDDFETLMATVRAIPIPTWNGCAR
jgi:hypothetical protein